jgi:phosphatidylinositol glycan class Z
MLLTSFVVDFSAHRIASLFPNEASPASALLVIAAAWPTLVLSVRPFSNAVESVLLSLVVLAISRAASRGHHRFSFFDGVAVGYIGAFGVFNRPTFVAFALAPAIWFAWASFWGRHKTAFSRVVPVFTAAGSFVVTSAAIIAFDTKWYDSSVPVIAPLNFVRYNSDISNLATHGVHPRWLHALVNMPILFGFLLIPAVSHSLSRKPLATLCSAIIVVSLAVLSLAPHQEFRFLLPLLLPVVLLGSKKLLYRGWWRGLLVAWVLFNVVMAIFFGVLH